MKKEHHISDRFYSWAAENVEYKIMPMRPPLEEETHRSKMIYAYGRMGGAIYADRASPALAYVARPGIETIRSQYHYETFVTPAGTEIQGLVPEIISMPDSAITAAYNSLGKMKATLMNCGKEDDTGNRLVRMVLDTAKKAAKDHRKLSDEEKRVVWGRLLDVLHPKFDNVENVYAAAFQQIGGYNSIHEDQPLFERIKTIGSALEFLTDFHIVSTSKQKGDMENTATIKACRLVEDLGNESAKIPEKHYALVLINACIYAKVIYELSFQAVRHHKGFGGSSVSAPNVQKDCESLVLPVEFDQGLFEEGEKRVLTALLKRA